MDKCSHYNRYQLVLFYVVVKYISDAASEAKQWPFSYIKSQADTIISKKVFSHLQHQSLNFHLSRESGRILRVVQRGAGSFVSILNMMVFNTLPILLKLFLVIGTVFTLYPWKYGVINIAMGIIYFVTNYVVAEYRAVLFRETSVKDAGSN